MHENSHPSGFTEKSSEFIKTVIHSSIFMQINLPSQANYLLSCFPLFFFTPNLKTD